MSILPCLMHLRIHNEEHSFGLWLPLFLAWLILAALAFGIITYFLDFTDSCLAARWGKFTLLIGPRIYNILCALKGLKVDINRQREQIAITFV